MKNRETNVIASARSEVGDDLKVIAIRRWQPRDPMGVMSPPNNYIGLILLTATLVGQLQMDGLQVVESTCAGDLNSGAIVIEVRGNLGTALETVKKALHKNFLNEFTTVGYFCQAEQYFRPVYPAGTAPFAIDFTAMAAENERTQAVLELAMVYVRARDL